MATHATADPRKTPERDALDNLIVRAPALLGLLAGGLRRVSLGSPLRKRLLYWQVRRGFDAMARSDVDLVQLYYEPDAEVWMKGLIGVGLQDCYRGHEGIRKLYAERELEAAGVRESPEVVLADAGYWSNDHIDRLRQRGMTPIVAPDAHNRDGPRRTRLGGPYDFMRRVLATNKGTELYSRRQWMVEPVFADIKQNRRAGRFKRRGRAAVRSEWRLIAATHNLLKLHRHSLAAAAA